jgi:hypothetical protein
MTDLDDPTRALIHRFDGVIDADTVSRYAVDMWDLPHPPGSDLDGVRAVRDDIDRRVQALLNDLTRKE